MMLSQKVASGAIWLVSARLATRVLDLLSMLIVARLLLPADFGLFALAATVLLILNAVSDLSLANALVQMADPQKPAYDTAFTLNLLRGCGLAMMLCAVAWPFADFYGDARLAPILLALALVPLLRGLSSPRMAHLQRALQFRAAFVFEAAGKSAAFVASVSVAFATQSYWALVAGLVAAPAISTLLSYRLAPYRPALGMTDWRPIFAFSGWLTLSNVVNTLNWQADRFFIGGQLGTTVLGQYTVGSDLASLPTNAPIVPIMQALYAGFAKLSHDAARLRAAYLASQCIVIALALPISVTVSVFAKTIILIAIGPEWASSAYVVQVLAPVFALQMLTAPAQSIAMVTGNTRSIFWRDVIALFIRLPLILAGMYLAGLEGVVWARVVSGCLIIVLNLLLIRRLLEVSVTQQLLAPWRSYLSGLAMGGFYIVAGSELGLLSMQDLWAVPQLLALAAVGAVLYGTVHMGLWAIARPRDSAEGKLLKMLPTRFRKQALL